MMIKISRQLKDLTRNLSKGNNGKAQFLLRNYAMERFMERMSLSQHKDSFILKGGVLVTAMVGLNMRMTMDIDTTIRNFSLTPENAEQIVGEISFQYKLMFEERYISVWAYNLETVLAEKLEAILVHSTLNTRLRDFYDVYILQNRGMQIDLSILSDAIRATCKKRGSEDTLSIYQDTLDQIERSTSMRDLWRVYQMKNSYADGITWEAAVSAARFLCDSCISNLKEDEGDLV